MTEEKKTNTPETEEVAESRNFILNFIDEDIAEGGQFQGMTVHTRFPPEPNGYLHIGHCKALTIDFGTAERYNGLCNLRMDDTNPTKEDEEFVEAIKQDIHWLGFDWGDRFFYGSDYFEEDYRQAVLLIKKGLAYVCELTPEEFKQNRGDIGIPAVSPYRDRPVEESLDLFARMRAGEFPNGAMTLRAKIDLTSGNFNMRDPVIYRINHMSHHRQGNKWCIYPMYDFAHPIQDALEGITHSLCSLEFEAHRPLYNWVIDHCELPARPRQIEFARLGIDHTVMSKRKLRQLVEQNYVSGWDDPRMPTICGLRRRGYTPASIRRFCGEIGVARADSMVEIELLHHCLREELNRTAPRRMAVLRPLKVVLENWPEDRVDELPAENNPEDPGAGSRTLAFGRELYIEQDDFRMDPPKGFFRLSPGREVRLKHAYLITCREAVTDEAGQVTELRCTVDLDSRGGDAPDGRKVKGTLHWVRAQDGVPATVRLYDHLFTLRDLGDMDPDKDYKDYLNPASLTELPALVEPALAQAAPGERFQFLRHGYFCADGDSTGEHPLFNLTVSLKDSWAKEQKKG